MTAKDPGTSLGRPPLRVLFLVPDLGIGGAERHVATLLPRLDRSRFAPSVICIGQRGPLFADLEHTGVPARALGRTKREAIAALVELVREMRRSRPDLVVVRGYSAEGLGRVAALVARVPRVVVWVHNHGDIEPRGWLRRLADRLLDPVTDSYYGVARAQIEYLTRELGHSADKITVVHNGVDPDRFDPTAVRDPSLASELGIGLDDPVLGIVAALRPEKDHVLLLRAFRTVVDDLPTARLLIVGDGPERGRLEKLTADLGLASQVIFAGSRRDVPALLGLIDVFTLSSYSIECFPMALLEAMAAGRPAVCTAVGGVSEMVEEGVTGYLVPARDEAALAVRYRALLSDRATARRFGIAARTAVESRFTLERSVQTAELAMERTAGRMAEVAPPIRLALVLDRTFVGGAEVVLLEMFRRFDPAVVRPRVICLREAGPLADDFRTSGFEVEVLHRSGRFDLRTVPRLWRSLRAHRTEVVLVAHHHRAALALGRGVGQLARARTVVAAHDMDLRTIGRRCLPRSTVETLVLADALVLLAPSQGEYLHRAEGVGRFPWRRTREVVIPNGIRIPPPPDPQVRVDVRTQLGYRPDDVVVGIVARLSPQKAHQVLFGAVAQLVDRCPRLRVLVVGGGEREAELVALAEKLNIADRVQFVGIRRDVTRLLAGLDMSCLSSVHEGVPLIVLESMAAGLPVVATDCGALRDIIEEDVTGHLVPVGDVDRLAARIGELSEDGSLRSRLGAAGRARAARDFGIEHTAAGYERLLTDLTRGGSRGHAAGS